MYPLKKLALLSFTLVLLGCDSADQPEAKPPSTAIEQNETQRPQTTVESEPTTNGSSTADASDEDALLTQLIDKLDETSARLEAGESTSDVQDDLDEMKAINERLDTLGLTDSEKQNLMRRHANRHIPAIERFTKAMATAGQ